MYYEEKIIDGKLMFRTNLNSDFIPVESNVSRIVNLLLSENEDVRMEVFSYFCKYCGSDDPDCQCWNDE